MRSTKKIVSHAIAKAPTDSALRGITSDIDMADEIEWIPETQLQNLMIARYIQKGVSGMATTTPNVNTEAYQKFHKSILKTLLIALGRVKIISKDYAWAEGGRVAEEYQRSGIGKILGQRSIDYAKSQNVKYIQYDTFTENMG